MSQIPNVEIENAIAKWLYVNREHLLQVVSDPEVDDKALADKIHEHFGEAMGFARSGFKTQDVKVRKAADSVLFLAQQLFDELSTSWVQIADEYRKLVEQNPPPSAV